MDSQTFYTFICMAHLLVSGRWNFKPEDEAASHLQSALADHTEQLSGRAMAPAGRAGFDPRPVRVNICRGELALGQVFPPVFRFSAVSIIPPLLHNHSWFTGAA